MTKRRRDRHAPMATWKKAILVAFALAPIGVLAFSVILMGTTEVAFDEATCPYEEREVRDVADGIRVREDARRCMESVEEHRWVLLRDDESPADLGIRRLDAAEYADYSWTAVLDGDHVRLDIQNPNAGLRVFLEQRPDAGP
ncbi:MAG: hypothetical protein AB7S26_35160 [Sandaracinaceae bacterium]